MGRHAEWRKEAKKLRRKRIRTMLAVARDQQLLEEQKKRENSPTYKAWLEEQQILEEFNASEELRLAMQRQKQWETAEEAALLRWREQQSRLAQAKAEKFKREMMIKEEWEREQRKIQEAEEARKKSEDEKKRKQAELLAQIDAFIEGRADFPDEVNVSTQTQPGQQDCPFFSKTGACRFRDSCSRNHTRPGISRTLMIPNFYDHFGLQTLNHDEYDTDLSLEYEESETYQHFKEFYNDVLPEFEQCGRVTQFKVCNNEEPHLRGNVYVEFQSRRHALKAYRKFQGRYYAGRRLNVEFTTIPSWKNAICGLFHRQKCPKGKTCNFLHVFRNPNNAFKIQDGHSSSRRQFSRSRSRSRSPHHRSGSKEWDWSDGSDSGSERKRKRSRSRSRSRSRARTRKYESDSDTNLRSRSRSPRRSKVHSKNRSRSRERDRKRREGKEKKKEERYRSSSRSPHYKNKKYKDSDYKRGSYSKYNKETELRDSKQGKKFKDDEKKKSSDYRNGKEANGREDSSKYSKHPKDDDRKRSIKDYEKEEYERKHKKDKREEGDKDRKSKKRSTDEYNSSSKKSSDLECNGTGDRDEKNGDIKSKNIQDDK